MHLRAIALTLTATILLVTGAACGGAAEPAGRENTRAAPAETSPAPAETPAPAPAETPPPPPPPSTPLAASTPVPALPSTPTPESTPAPLPTPTPAPLVFGKGATSLHEALGGGGGPSVILAVLMSGGEAVINAGAEIVSPDGSRKCCWTPLHVAVTTSDPHVVSMLVDRGADIDARTGDGQTPCQLAANRLAGLPAHFRICPTAGSDSTPAQTALAPTEAGPGREFSVDGAILKGGTALHEVAATAGPADVKDLLDRGADIHAKVDVYFTGSGSSHTGATALHIAAGFNPDPAVTKLLVDRGVDVDAKTGGGSTPLHFAAQNNEPAVVDLLLQRDTDLGVKDDNGNTPCQLFQQNEHFTGHSSLEVLCGLIAGPATPTPTPTPAAPGRPSGAAASDTWRFTGIGDTPLHQAALSGGPGSVRELLDQGADIHARAEMQFGETALTVGDWTPLHVAAWLNPDPAVAALLLDRGAQIDARTTRDYTPLHGAARYNQFPVVILLVERGADVNATTGSGASPLQYAAANEDPDVAALLLGLGVDVNHRSNSNSTPLHTAAANGSPEVVILLLERGAESDINAENERGTTPLHYATQLNSNPEVASILVSGGADLQAQDNQGRTPCLLAQQNTAFTGHPILDFLCAS